MSKQQIPINDLLQYLDEQEENNTISCGWTIIDYIYGHYNLLSKRNIHTPTAWIFLTGVLETMEQFQNTLSLCLVC